MNSALKAVFAASDPELIWMLVGGAVCGDREARILLARWLETKLMPESLHELVGTVLDNVPTPPTCEMEKEK